MNRLLIATMLAGMTASAQAASFALVPQAGLSGVGATVQWGFTPYLAMSAGYTALDYSVKDVKTDKATYNGDLSLRNPQVFLNWAPFGGHFRLSAGVVNQQSHFDLTASDFKDPDPTKTPVSDVNIKADYAKSLAPALTVGWESPILANGLGYHLSVGAMYAGEPVVRATATCKGGAPSQPTCDAYTANERKNVEDELRSYKVLPILQAGLIFRM